ncbi:hypothetical protein ABEV16_12430, partial [Geobacillus stearothermophilus]
MGVHTERTSAVSMTVYPIFVRISLGHFLNDAMQAVIPALFPILRSTAASFTLAAAPWRLGGLAAERPDIASVSKIF